MEFKLDNDVIAAAFKEGVKEAMADPDFRRELFEHVAQAAAHYVYLSRKELAEMLGRSELTVARWAKRNKLDVQPALGPKQPIYPLTGVQTALQKGTIRARQSTAGKRPAPPIPLGAVNGHDHAPGAPLRGVVILKH